MMTNERREKYHKILDGDLRLLPLLYQCERFVRCDEILNYLVRNNITGSKLLDYYMSQNRSPLNLLSDILKRVDKNKKKQKILAGRDYIV